MSMIYGTNHVYQITKTHINQISYAHKYKTIPHKANHQQQRHPERIHPRWKKHELL